MNIPIEKESIIINKVGAINWCKNSFLIECNNDSYNITAVH